MQSITRTNDARIDELEAAMIEAALSDDNDINFVDCPLNHFFYPGLYVRQILMPKGSLITSKIHKTCHPFRVMQGVVHVKIDDDEWELIEAPYAGTTKPGTRRVLYIEEDTVWETFHALDFVTGDENELEFEKQMDIVKSIEDKILEPYENKLLGGQLTRNNLKLTV